MRRKLLLLGVVLAGIAMAELAPPARADFELRVSDGTNTVIVQDNMAGDTNPSTGVIVVNTATLTTGGITGWSTINVNTAFSNATLGLPFAQMDIGTAAMSDLTGPLTTLTIDISQTGFTMPASAPNFGMTSQAMSTSVPGTETVQGYYDSTNSGTNLFSIPGQAQTTQQTVTAFPNPVLPGNPVTTYIVPGVSPFSLDYREVLTPTANAQFFSTDNQLTVSAPEPSGLALVFCGALTLGGYIRKRRKAAIA